MSVCALLVLGDKIRSKIDEQTQEQWLLSYIGESLVTMCCSLKLVNFFLMSTMTSFNGIRSCIIKRTNEPYSEKEHIN